jgi:hypothetical protein
MDGWLDGSCALRISRREAGAGERERICETKMKRDVDMKDLNDRRGDERDCVA